MDALLDGLQQERYMELFDHNFHQRCVQRFQDFDSNGSGFMEGEELRLAVQSSIPASFLSRRLHIGDVTSLALAFDEDLDGRMNCEEFTRFCQWIVAMELHGYFSGTAPLATIAEDCQASRLLIISEFLDPEHTLQGCVLPDVKCVHYDPMGLTLEEFSAQLESAAYIRGKKCSTFSSVALANHGPTEDGFWYVCADQPVHLSSTHESWSKLMPMFRALADMVARPDGSGRVDLLACQFAATKGGLDCIEMIEREAGTKFAASTDATGNIASGGNWDLEIGGRNVAPIYFDESRLHAFHGLMEAGSAVKTHHHHALAAKKHVGNAQKAVHQDKEALMASLAADSEQDWIIPETKKTIDIAEKVTNKVNEVVVAVNEVLDADNHESVKSEKFTVAAANPRMKARRYRNSTNT